MKIDKTVARGLARQFKCFHPRYPWLQIAVFDSGDRYFQSYLNLNSHVRNSFSIHAHVPAHTQTNAQKARA